MRITTLILGLCALGAPAHGIQALQGTAPGSSAHLRLPGGQPPRFTTSLETGGRMRHLVLERVSFRAPTFRVRAWVEGSGLVEVPVGEPTTYLGHVLGEPRSAVVASLTGRGLSARIDSGDGEVWLVEPDGRGRASESETAHRVRAEDPAALDFGPCGTDFVAATAPPPLPPQLPFDDLVPLDCLKQAEIAFDADFEYYQDYGSSVPNTVARIEEILAQVNFYYARDVKIVHQLTEIVVRTAPFYTPTSGGSLLNQFRSHWNQNMQHVPRDVTHLMTGKPGSLIEFGGLAFVGVVCTNSQYGWSMDGANIVGHEVGHNWGAPHCLDPSPCNNMCGACLLILPNTKRVIEDHRDSRGCLDDVGPFFRAVPPYATPETVRLRKNVFETSGPIELDVLANDHDGNCQPVSIVAFDAVSSRGAPIALVPAASLVDRPRLVYTPGDVFIGEDTFAYTIEDSSGQQATAVQRIEVLPTKLTHYWPFDETSGSTAADATGGGADGLGTVPGQWTPGMFDGALEFDGTQILTTGALSFPRPWSVSVWVRRRAGASGGSSIIESSNGSLRIQQPGGENVGVTRYSQGHSTFDYVAPLDTWVHLVFTGTTPDGTSLWVDGQFEGQVPALIRAPTGSIGRAASPLFATLDDLRVYDYELNATQIAQLHATGGRAEVPCPEDGGALVFPSAGLSWVPGPEAASHDVYLGTSYSAVRNATNASPEFQGNQAGTTFVPGPLTPNVTYYWRVDEVGSSTAVGDVWQFDPAEVEHWRLDETSGTVASNSGAGPDGTYAGGTQLGQPGATGVLGNSITLDGVDDRVSIPALDLDTDRMTITCWLRRDGSQLDWAGIVFSRAANTTAGLNFGTDEELRYHWNGGAWPWNSGLVVPDNEWVFVALVVEPGAGTIYLGQGGSLTSATNATGHAAEEFDGTLFIGRDNGFSNRDFKGSIDDVRIYRAALTASEVETLYTNSQ